MYTIKKVFNTLPIAYDFICKKKIEKLYTEEKDAHKYPKNLGRQNSLE